MNILMLHPHDIYSNSEPWTVRITYLATEFVKRGHNVRLIYHLIDPRMSLEEATARQEYPFVTIPCYRGQIALIAKMKTVLEFARWADVIHFQKCFPHVSIPALWAGYRLGKPVHYDWDDWEFGIYNYNPMNRLVGTVIDAFEKHLPHMVDSVSVASEALRRMAIERGVPEARIFDGHVGADLDRFRPDIDGRRVREDHHIEGPVVLYIGQLHGAQYLELFLAAAKAVLARGASPTFLVVGGGERFGELFQVTENMGIGHKVIFTGAVDHELVPEYIAAADVAVACFEDTEQVRTKSPLKICEYLASSKAIVASSVGEVPRMIGDAGVLVPPGDPEALADGIVRLLGDPELRRRLGEKARVRAEVEFNWGVTAERMLRAYEMILHETRWMYWKTGPRKPGEGPFLVQPSGPPRGIPASKLPPKPPEAPVRVAARSTERKTESAPTPASEPKSVPEPETRKSEASGQKSLQDSTTDMRSAKAGFPAGGNGAGVAASGVAAASFEPIVTPTERSGPKPANGNGSANGASSGWSGFALPSKKKGEAKAEAALYSGPPRPPRYRLGPFNPLRSFIEGNLDIIGVLDGKLSYVGPHTVQFDPTDVCPNDCIACWCRSPLLLDKRLSKEEQRQKLDISIFMSVLDELVAMGTKEIYIAGGGEPMVYPKILELCESIKRRGLICNVNTSFINVDRETARELARMKVDYMTVSIWAATPETYVLTHPSKTEEAFWDLKGTLTYLNEIKETVPFVKNYNVLSNLNFHEIKKMVDFAIETKSDSVEFTLVDTIPDRTDALLLTDEQQKWLHEEALRIQRWIVGDEKERRVKLFMFDQFLRRISGAHTTIGEHDRTIIDAMPCTVGWQFARVLANGKVNSCLKSHRIPIGTLHERSFKDLWTNKKQAEFRKKTNVYTKSDPWFGNIGNDPDAACGCYKSCDDLGRVTHMYNRIEAMPGWKMAILKAAQLWLRTTGQYIK